MRKRTAPQTPKNPKASSHPTSGLIAEDLPEALPEVPMIWISGDSAWEDGKDHKPDLDNLGNIGKIG